MPLTDPAYWSEHLRRNLRLYDEALLRHVADRLIKPRSQWPVADLIRRMAEAAENAAVIDRRLAETTPADRQLLAMIDHSRQSRWPAGHLVELLAALDHSDPLSVIRNLLDGGLLYLELAGDDEDEPAGDSRRKAHCQSFDDWLGRTGANMVICAHPWITRRAAGETLPLPDLSQSAAESANGQSTAGEISAGTVRESDGLEWLLRLAVLWQQVRDAPLRRTQQGEFFKRDLDRLRSDSLLAGQPADAILELPDLGLLAVALGGNGRVLMENDGQLVATADPPGLGQTLPETVVGLWSALLGVDHWDAEHGWASDLPGNPFPSAYLLCLLLLAQVRGERWCAARGVSDWVLEHHPYWKLPKTPRPKKQNAGPAEALLGFLLGLAFSLRLVQVRQSEGEWQIRLSNLGHWLLGRREPLPQSTFPQTLLVQPNLEILVYRQGLTPDLLAQLTRFARWKTVGAACSMQLEPASVYAALESGASFELILQTLQRHGIKPPPGPVIDSLRTWSQKRERITVYPAALILEFLSATDLEDALARGVPAERIGPLLAIIPRETDIDYRHFRLISNRDYTLPPERCVAVADDGVTLRVDLNRSDLLLESELRRFASELEASGSVRVFRIMPDSVRAGRELRISVDQLEAWFEARCDQPMTPAARLLLTGADQPASVARRLTVVAVASAGLADGLLQWPQTRHLIEERLGPTALVVAEEKLPELRQSLRALGMEITGPPE